MSPEFHAANFPRCRGSQLPQRNVIEDTLRWGCPPSIEIPAHEARLPYFRFDWTMTPTKMVAARAHPYARRCAAVS